MPVVAVSQTQLQQTRPFYETRISEELGRGIGAKKEVGPEP